MQNSLLLFLVLSLVCRAETLDKASQEALDKTMELLRSPMKRGVEIHKSDRARDADANVQNLAGSAENSQRLYELAALIMENLVKQTKGDPDKMMEMLDKAQKDPSAFADTFTPAQKKLLKELATDIEKTKGTKAVP